MTKPIDYSKWEKIDSDDSNDESSCGSNFDNITKLPNPSSISIGPNGVVVQPTVPQSIPSGKSTAKCIEVDPAEELTKNGGKEGCSHWWAQTRETVTVSFLVPFDSKGKYVHSFRVFEVEKMIENSVINRPRIEFHIKTATCKEFSVSKDFYFPLNLDSNLLEGCWELKTVGSNRFLVVQLLKKEVAPGVFIWWDRCFSSDTMLVDLSKIEGRKSAGKEFQEVWNEAHEMFKNRVEARRKGRR